MRVEPYLNFDGRADEAIKFYKKAVGAKVTAYLDDSTVQLPQCFTPVPQLYTLAWTNRIGCRSFGTKVQVNINPAGVSSSGNIGSKVLISATSGRLYVLLPATTTFPASLQLHDLSGKAIFQAVLTRPQSEWHLPSGLASGVYIYSLIPIKGEAGRGTLMLR